MTPLIILWVLSLIVWATTITMLIGLAIKTDRRLTQQSAVLRALGKGHRVIDLREAGL